MQVAYLILIGLSLFSFASFLFLSYQSKKSEEETFNFRQYFIYEAFSGKKDKFIRVLQAIFLLCNVSVSLLLYFLPHDETITSKYYFLMVSAFEIIVCLFFFSLSVLSFNKEKLRVACFMFYGGSIAIRNGTCGIILLSISRATLANNSTLAMTFAVVSFIFAGLALLPLLNPKLSNYAKLEQVSEKDGTLSYQRPKYFVMAFSEWLLTFLSEISFATILIFFYLVA